MTTATRHTCECPGDAGCQAYGIYRHRGNHCTEEARTQYCLDCRPPPTAQHWSDIHPEQYKRERSTTMPKKQPEQPGRRAKTVAFTPAVWSEPWIAPAMNPTLPATGFLDEQEQAVARAVARGEGAVVATVTLTSPGTAQPTEPAEPPAAESPATSPPEVTESEAPRREYIYLVNCAANLYNTKEEAIEAGKKEWTPEREVEVYRLMAVIKRKAGYEVQHIPQRKGKAAKP